MKTYRAKGQGFAVKFNDLDPQAAVLWATFGASREPYPLTPTTLPLEQAKAEAVRIASLPLRRVQAMAVACCR
jgi:hypothetical protein